MNLASFAEPGQGQDRQWRSWTLCRLWWSDSATSACSRQWRCWLDDCDLDRWCHTYRTVRPHQLLAAHAQPDDRTFRVGARRRWHSLWCGRESQGWKSSSLLQKTTIDWSCRGSNQIKSTTTLLCACCFFSVKVAGFCINWVMKTGDVADCRHSSTEVCASRWRLQSRRFYVTRWNWRRRVKSAMKALEMHLPRLKRPINLLIPPLKS